MKHAFLWILALVLASPGAPALVEGTAKVRTLSESEARHIEAERRGGDPESIDGPKRELGFVASGVRLLSAAPTTEP